MISDRTKAGLAAAKARGVKLGGPRLPAINETRQADALERARAIAPILSELTGISARAVAAELNARQVETPSGAPWSAKTVIRARKRLIWNCALGARPGGPPVARHTPPSGLPPRRPLPRRWAVVSCLPIKIPSLIPRRRAKLNAVGQDRLTVSGDPERRRFDCECHCLRRAPAPMLSRDKADAWRHGQRCLCANLPVSAATYATRLTHRSSAHRQLTSADLLSDLKAIGSWPPTRSRRSLVSTSHQFR
jgi:hypothetical protein